MLKRGTSRDTIVQVKNYLSTNYTYSLDITKPGRDDNFLSRFLFEQKKGYCVHFATAFTLLCRMNGIPARYVTGYLVQFPDDSEVVTVSALQGHAWAEVWLSDTGWTTIEATAALDVASAPSDIDHQDFDEMDRMTRRQLSAIRGETGPNQSSKILHTYILIGGIIIISICICSCIIWAIFKYRRYRITQKTMAPPTALKIVDLFEKQGVPRPDAVGWLQWKQEAIHLRPLLRRHITLFVDKILVYLYRGEQVRSIDRKFYILLYRKCEKFK